MPINQIVGSFQEEAEQVSYISEQTHEVNAFVIGRAVTMLDAAAFQTANPFVAGKPIETLDVQTVCAAQGNDWLVLKSMIADDLTDGTAFKVGAIRREVYLVGLHDGRIVGVKTFAVET